MQFTYKAKNNRGEAINGLVEAGSKAEATGLVEERGYSVVSISIRKHLQGFSLSFLERVKQRDLVAFYRSLAMMIEADISVVQSLKIIAGQTENKKLQNIIADVYSNVNEGMKLSDALAIHNRIFGDFYVYMIRSGEASGRFDAVLNYLADSQEKEYQFKAKLKGAMTYPIFIMAAMFLMGVIVMVFVIPRLTAILLEAHVELPLATKILITASTITQRFWYLIIGGVFGGMFLIRFAISRVMFAKKIWHWLILLIPIFGRSLTKKTCLVRLTRNLSLLLTGGVPLIDALGITGSVVGNVHYEEMLKQTAETVKDGNPIASVFARYPRLIPPMLTQMTSIGEQTGKIDQVFEKIGDFYSREVETLVDNLSRIIEPVIMLIMGFAVAFLVFAIMLPMFQATQAVA